MGKESHQSQSMSFLGKEQMGRNQAYLRGAQVTEIVIRIYDMVEKLRLHPSILDPG